MGSETNNNFYMENGINLLAAIGTNNYYTNPAAPMAINGGGGHQHNMANNNNGGDNNTNGAQNPSANRWLSSVATAMQHNDDQNIVQSSSANRQYQHLIHLTPAISTSSTTVSATTNTQSQASNGLFNTFPSSRNPWHFNNIPTIYQRPNNQNSINLTANQQPIHLQHLDNNLNKSAPYPNHNHHQQGLLTISFFCRFTQVSVFFSLLVVLLLFFLSKFCDLDNG